MRVAKIVGVDFLVNVAITHDRRPAGVYAGDMVQAHLAGVKQVSRWSSAKVDAPFDLVVTCAGGFPLDQSIYQTVKGICGAMPAMSEKSTLLIASACHEIGSPECVETLRRWAHDWRGFLEHIKATPVVVKDQWQLQMHARVLALIGVERLCFVCDNLPAQVLRGLAVNPVEGTGDAAARIQRFMDDFLRQHPGARMAVVPEGPYTMLVR
jgi:nickel-dependent lactate racemase